jgi:hypothetical protein
MMSLLWYKNNKPGSKLIRWGLEEEASHFAMGFFINDQQTSGVIVHQKFEGFDIDWYPYYAKHNKLVYGLTPKDTSITDQRSIFHKACEEFSGLDYERTGFIYFGWRAALRKFFGKPLPDRNTWGGRRDILCTGQARVLQTLKPDWFSKLIPDFDIVTPQALYENMLNSGKFLLLNPL